jgi:hypothetical protein
VLLLRKGRKVGMEANIDNQSTPPFWTDKQVSLQKMAKNLDEFPGLHPHFVVLSELSGSEYFRGCQSGPIVTKLFTAVI